MRKRLCIVKLYVTLIVLLTYPHQCLWGRQDDHHELKHPRVQAGHGGAQAPMCLAQDTFC